MAAKYVNMKIKGLFLLIYALIFYTSPAQIMFQRHYGGAGDDSGNAVIQTSDGGYLVVGVTNSWGAGSMDIYLIKTNEYGDTTWTKHYGGYNWDSPVRVLEGTDSFYYLSGNTSSQGSGATDIFLMKVSQVGDSIWLKTYGGSGDESGNDLIECQDGGFMIVGVTMSFASGIDAIYAIRTNLNGDTLWTNTYEKENVNDAFAVLQVETNGFLIAGTTSATGGNIADCYVVRTNENGDTLWTKTYGGSMYNCIYSISKTADGNYLLCGATNRIGNGTYDAYLLKIDTMGNMLWEKGYGGAGLDYCYSCTVTASGAVIVGKTESFGSGGYDAYLFKINEDGDTLWTKTYGGSADDWAGSIKETTDGGYIISGYTLSFSSFSDVYLIKTRSDGFASIESNDFTEGTISTYPNPCADFLNISFETIVSNAIVIELINMQGQRFYYLQKNQNTDNLVSINTSSMPKGLYLLKIASNDKITTQEIIIN